MKLFLFYLLFFFNFSFSQCKISDIAPFKLGSSKFEASIVLNKLNTIPRETIYGSDTNEEWAKYSYLKNDSIYKVVINKDLYSNDCIIGNKNRFQLTFADDKLYRMCIYQEFKADQYDIMLEYYKNLLNIFSETYPYSGGFKLTNFDTKEKIGEGYRFSNVPQEKKPKIKIKDIRVSYNINYKKIWNNYSRQYDKTSDIDYYEIEIEFTDLKGTKLTNEGY